jgi:hypothetical protein
MNRSRYPAVLLALTLGLSSLSACTDSSTPAADELGVTFAYAGSVRGRFRANGPASDALDPRKSFAVAFRSSAGELQLCAYQAMGAGSGNFLLLNVGAVAGPGSYAVPPGWAPLAAGYQPGTFLLEVDAPRTGVGQISPFVEGQVTVQELSADHVRGMFAVTTQLTALSGGTFDVPLAEIAELPVICQ